jgi:uroporphyrinogen decarboxylase
LKPSANVVPLSEQPEPTERFLRACRRLPVDKTPVWMMRQAGRYMEEYRALRARYTMLECINTPELAAEITMQPINAFEMDAAIIFSDILPPLIGMGLDLDFVKGKGPVISNPITTTKDVDMLATPPAESCMQGTLDAITLVKKELEPRGIPLIGFCGAPFTMASYAIEGGGSKNYEKAKRMMYGEPAAWDRLMKKIVTISADYLSKQAKAGADALQIFDSWAGALSQRDYIRFVQPYNKELVAMAKRNGVPVILFGTKTTAYLDTVSECGSDVVGVDWQLPVEKAWTLVGEDKAVMGNLDPVLLQAPWRELKYQLDQILDGVQGREGYIFNLGHGILPSTPVDNVRRVVDYVHERTQR